MSRFLPISSKTLFREIYGNDPAQNPSENIISKIKEQIPKLPRCSKSVLHKFYCGVDSRIAHLNRMDNCWGMEEFNRLNEWISLMALKSLLPLHHSRKCKKDKSGLQLTQLWKQILLKGMNSRDNRWSRTFDVYVAINWAHRFMKMENMAQVHLKGLDTLYKKLQLPSNELFKNYYLKLEEYIEDGEVTGEVAGFQTLDNGTLIALDLSPENIVARGGSSLIYRCSALSNKNDQYPLFPVEYKSSECVLKLGNGPFKGQVYEDYKNLKILHETVSLEEERCILPNLSSYYFHRPSVSVSDDNIIIKRSNSTEYVTLRDVNSMSVSEKERLAWGYIVALHRFFQLGYLPQQLEGEQLLLRRQGASLEVCFSHECNLMKVPGDAHNQLQFCDYMLGVTLYAFLTNGHNSDEAPVDHLRRLGYSQKLTNILPKMLCFQPVKVGLLPKKVTLLESDAFCGMFLPLYNKGNFITPHGSFGTLTYKHKMDITRGLLSNLAILMKYNLVLCDLRWENMLVSQVGNRYNGAFCDYAGLIFFEHPLVSDPAKFQNLCYRFNNWTPNDLPFHEFIEIRKLLESIDLSNRREAQSSMEEIQARLNNMQKFIVGMALCDLFLGQLPYKRVPWNTLSHHPVYPDDSYRSFTFSDNFYNQSYKNALKKSTMEPLGDLLINLIHPDPSKRPSLYELNRFLKNVH